MKSKIKNTFCISNITKVFVYTCVALSEVKHKDVSFDESI